MITVGLVCPPVVDFVFFFIVFNVHPQKQARRNHIGNEGVWGLFGPKQVNIK